jgi:hypothetical protein
LIARHPATTAWLAVCAGIWIAWLLLAAWLIG